MSAIALAGGDTYRANRIECSYSAGFDTGFHEYPLSPTTPVKAGDLIRVPERNF